MSALALGTLMPEFTLEEPLTGRKFSSKDLAPRSPAVIAFISNHCPSSLAWEERLLQLGRQYHGQAGMVLISADDPERSPECTPEAIATRAREHDYPVPYLFDADQSVALAFDAERTPDVFVFSEDRLVYHGTVDDNEDEPDEVKSAYLQDALAALLAGRPIAIAETPLVGCGIRWTPGGVGSIRYTSKLLASGNWSPEDLASRMGYDDYAYFARRFEEVTGRSPEQFQPAVGREEG